jgi:micrococcal nuclease
VAGPVEAEVTKVIDGDTIAVEAKIWLDQWVAVHIRLRGIDTPELHSHCEAETARAEEAMNFVIAEVEKGNITLTDIGTDKYGGRAVANVITASGEDLGQLLLKKGLARPYTGGHKTGWCDE